MSSGYSVDANAFKEFVDAVRDELDAIGKQTNQLRATKQSLASSGSERASLQFIEALAPEMERFQTTAEQVVNQALDQLKDVTEAGKSYQATEHEQESNLRS